MSKLAPLPITIKEEHYPEIYARVRLISRYERLTQQKRRREAEYTSVAEMLEEAAFALTQLPQAIETQDDMHRLALRMQCIDHYRELARMAAHESMMLQHSAEFLREALTVYLAEQYFLDMRRQFHLDLDSMTLSYGKGGE